MFISYCPELDLYSQGETIKQATENISEATHLFIQSCIQRNTLNEVLTECGFTSYKQQSTRKQRNKSTGAFSGAREVQIPAEIPMMMYDA